MDPGHAVGLCVRSVKVCPGDTFCKRGLQETLALGMEIDKLYHGMQLPAKFKMGVSGCPNKCADSASVDLGLMGTSKGYHLYVGGNGGVKPRQGTILLENLQKEQIFPVVNAVISYFKQNAKPHERLGRLLDRIGIEGLHEFAEKAMH